VLQFEIGMHLNLACDQGMDGDIQSALTVQKSKCIRDSKEREKMSDRKGNKRQQKKTKKGVE
jgi:hypothetical protein